MILRPLNTTKAVAAMPMSEIDIMLGELQITPVKVHRLHLQVQSFEKHSALGSLYDSLFDLVDDIIEQYQGIEERIIRYPESCTIPNITSQDDVIEFLRALYTKVNTLQSKVPYSEIQNLLDEVKSVIAKIKYKIIFLP